LKTATLKNDFNPKTKLANQRRIWFCSWVAQRFALPALGRAAGRRPTGKMIRRRKMLGIAPESPASGARFVSWRFAYQDTWLK